MTRLPTIAVLVLASVLASALAPAARAARPQEAEQVVKALDQWLKTYQKNKVDLGSNADISATSLGRKYDALPKGMLGRLTARRELEELLKQAVAHESKETLLATLAVAAIGGDDYRYDFRALPYVARGIGEQALSGFQSEASRTELRAIARDGSKGAKGTGEAMQGAALRALAGFADAATDLPILEGGLAHKDADVRAGAADGFGRLGATAALPALARAIDAESEPRAMEALARAARAVLVNGGDERARGMVATSAAQGLGRTSWRADEALIELLSSARESAAVPALIGVLERFLTDGKRIRAGDLSGVLRFRAHQALIDLTGAFFPAEDPQRWREWWDQNRATFKVVEHRPDAAAGKTVSGFFGIPVEGTRVIFVIDLSLSMEAKMPPLDTSTDDKSKWPSRLDVAREQVWSAAQRLSEDAVFDVVVFSNEARSWQGKLVAANDANRKKLRKFLDELKPEPYTNLWEGIRKAMEFEPGSIAANNTFELDELFLLSDGAPTIGEIQDPPEILKVVTEANRYKRIRIHTVFLQGEVSNMDPVTVAGQMGPAELMEAIARDNDGRFVKR